MKTYKYFLLYFASVGVFSLLWVVLNMVFLIQTQCIRYDTIHDYWTRDCEGWYYSFLVANIPGWFFDELLPYTIRGNTPWIEIITASVSGIVYSSIISLLIFIAVSSYPKIADKKE